jgi:transposase
LAFKRGEPRVCSMVRPPTPEQEDCRRLVREYGELTSERVHHVNRIKGLLFTQGVLDYRPLRRDRRQQLAELRSVDGRPLSPHLKAAIDRLLDRLELLVKQMKALIAALRALTAEAKAADAKADAEARIMAQLLEIRGIGPVFAAVLVTEGLFRQFDNRRQVAAYAGLAPSPWRSGTIHYEQGVSKAGNKRLRTTMVQMAWLWLRHQPTTALARWFEERVRHNGGSLKKVMITALARKLLVALWKYVTQGVIIEGMAMTEA